MKRKLKFRAKDLIHNQWIYGGIAEDRKGNTVILPKNDWSKGGCVDVETVGQFTGLHDKYGKEIYEGDILGIDINGMNKKLIGMVEGGVRGYCYDVVYLNHHKGEERWSLYGTVMHDFPNRIEVTGNIYDNPELLEE